MSLTPLEIRFEAAVGDYREACPSLTCLRWRRRTDPGEHHVRTNGAEDPAPRDPRPVRDRQTDPQCGAQLENRGDRQANGRCWSARPTPLPHLLPDGVVPFGAPRARRWRSVARSRSERCLRTPRKELPKPGRISDTPPASPRTVGSYASSSARFCSISMELAKPSSASS